MINNLNLRFYFQHYLFCNVILFINNKQQN